MKQKRLVLFDIDGTLLRGGRLWRECFEGAFAHCFPGQSFPKVSFSGKTDRQICREMMAPVGFSSAEIDACTDRVLTDYLARIARAVPSRASEVELLPGVPQLLDRLESTEGVLLGLLTGNVRLGADLKLSAVGIHRYFRLGAYGDDHWDRYQLPAIAVSRAHSNFGIRFEGKEVVILGDTVHDVCCGKSIGVRSVAVGTGRGELREEILKAEPDHFFEDFRDTESVVEAILK